MAAGAEIDLGTLDQEIIAVDKSIQMLTRDFDKLPEKLNKLQKTQLARSFETIESLMTQLSRKMNSLDYKGVTSLIEEINKLAASYTKLRESAGSAGFSVSSIANFKGIADAYQKSKEILEQNKVILEKIAEKERQIAREKERSLKYEAEKTARMQDQINAQNQLKQRLAELKGNVAKGDITSIQKYLSGGLTAEKLNNVIAGLKKAQSQVALGSKEWRQYNAMIDECNRRLNMQNGLMSRIHGAMGPLKNYASQIAMSFGVMTGVFGASQFVRSLYRITSEFQLQQRALAAIVNNAREANILFKQMQTLAVESPMKLMDLNKYAKQLAAFKIETKDLYSSLKMLGDISVGVGVNMDRLILAYGQVKAANYLRGQELRQFSEAGVNILGSLQEYYRVTKGINMSINDIFESVSKRKVLFEDVEAALKRLTEAGGTFYNMQLIQSQTLYGQSQKLADMFQIEMNNIGKAHSGTMLAIVKIAQELIKNLKLITNAFIAVGAARGLMTLAVRFKESKVAAETLFKAVRTTRKEVSLLSIAGMKKFIASVKAAEVSFASLQAIVSATTLALTVGFTLLINRIQKSRQAAEDLSNEIIELNKRKREIGEIAGAYEKEYTFGGQLALLQQLVKKAEEYNLKLSLPEKITASNITEVFKEATRQIEDYVEQVQYYNAAILSGKGVEKAVKKLDNLNVGFALAQGSAENLYNYLIQNENQLPAFAQKQFDSLRKIYEEYRKDEDAAVKKYGMTTSEWKLEFMRRVSALRGSMDEFTEGQTWSSFGPDNEAFDYQMDQIDRFFDKYDNKIKKATRKINKALKKQSIDLKGWGDLSDEALKKIVEQNLPPIIETFKQFGDFSKEQIEEIISRISGVPREKIVRIMYELNNGDSDFDEDTSVKILRRLLGEDDVVEKDVVLNIETKGLDEFGKQIVEKMKDGEAFKLDLKALLTPDKSNQKEAEKEYYDFLKNAQEPARDAARKIWESNDSWEKKVKSLRDEYKRLQDEMDRYQRKGSSLVLLNDVLGHSYSSVAVAVKDMKDAQDYITETLDRLGVGVDDKKTKSRTQSYKSEFQSMIEFIKKLNSEYEKLRSTFNQADTEWMGAFHRTIDSYKEAFDAMPEEFKSKFGNLITNIHFMTKEATADSMHELEELINNTGKLTLKEKKELLRDLHMAIGGLKEEVDIKLKKGADARLHEQIDKIFSDYQLTLELEKLDIDVESVASTFNIDTTSLSEVYRKLQEARDKFQGEEEVKKYREYVRKLTEINDKANLEMSKNYAKYLQKELDERAKVELEYMKKRAEVMALPFGKNEAAILEGLQKELKKKLDELDWKQFQSSDFYIQLFEDLGFASDQALTTMLDKLKELKSTLTNLSPTELKTLTDQMLKIEEQLINRNPFRELVKSFKEIKAMKGDKGLQDVLEEFIGDDKIKGFKDRAEAALAEINKQMMEQENKRSKLMEKSRAREIVDASDIRLYDEEELKSFLEELEKERKEVRSDINKIEQQGEVASVDEQNLEILKGEAAAIDEQIRKVTDLYTAWQMLGFDGSKSLEEIQNELNKTNQQIETLAGKKSKVKALTDELTEQQKAAIAFANAMVEMIGKMKGAFDSVWDYADALGATTDSLTDAWKEFGDTIFDTITKALEMIPTLITGFTSAGIAINSAMGIIGLIAEVIQLVITLATALAKVHDAKIQRKIDKLQKSVDDLKKSAEDLEEVFDNLFSTDKIRVYNAAIVEAKETTIETLNAMIDAEEDKKKKDQEQIDEWKDEIASLESEIIEQTEAFYEALGGFGSLANMKSMAEEWTDAWYEAFKETGDGLSGLEDSFDEFLDNLYKKQILNNIAEKYFAGMYEELDRILAKEGGLTENRDEFTDWLNRIQQVFYDFNEEAGEYATALQAMGGTGADLEGLTASIQGMTEDTADALVAYLNSIRLHIAGNTDEIEQLRMSLCVDNSTNPIISQLKIIALQTTGINTLLSSVVAPSSATGSFSGPCIKVVM